MNGQIKSRAFHFVGIGGAGMSGLALAANELGAVVTGSDRGESTYVERLRAAGIDVTIGHDAKNVPPAADVVRSTAIGDDNPELSAALERGQRVLHRSELLAELAALRETCVTVAGSHGKTTTTAMIAHVLERLELDPSFFVGGEVTIGARTTNAHMGDGDVVVIEADESDGSFVRYAPDIAVITNIEFEHPETWSGLDQLMAAFARHVAAAPVVVVEAEQPRLDELALGSRAVSFSIVDPSADYFGANLITPPDPQSGSSFELGELQVQLGVRGDYNVKNALAALAALESLGIERTRCTEALSDFRGVARRFELVGRTETGTAVYDDYAHHPTEIRAALETARATAQGGRVVAFFQPHLYSRSIAYRREFAEALALADVVVVLEIYPARESASDFPGVSGWMTATSVADVAAGRPVYFAADFDDAAQLADRLLVASDLCIALGAGDIFELSRRLVETG